MVGYLAVGVYQVDPLRSRAVCLVDAVVHLLDQYGDGDVQAQAARLGNLFPLVIVLVLPEIDFVLHIGVNLPPVGGVGLLHIDYEEFHLSGEPVLYRLDTPHLGAEGRSSIAAEDQGNGTLASEFGEAYPVIGAEKFQVEVRGKLASGRALFVPLDYMQKRSSHPIRDAIEMMLQYFSCKNALDGRRFPAFPKFIQALSEQSPVFGG